MYIRRRLHNEMYWKQWSTDEIDRHLTAYELNGVLFSLDMRLENATTEQLQRYHDIQEKLFDYNNRAYVRCVCNLNNR